MNDSEHIDSARRDISLLAVWSFLARHKGIIIPSVLVCAVASTALTFVMKPKYRAEVVFSPVASAGRLGSGLSNSLGGLSALAGVNIGGVGKRAGESLEYP